MSDKEGSPPSRSRSRSRSYSRSRSKSPYRSVSRGRSYSRSRSRSRGRHYSRERSPSPYYRRGGARRHTRSRSRSRGDRGDRRHGYYRSHSRSPMSNRRRHTGSRDNPEEGHCLGVFGLSLYTQERDLRDVFERMGPVNNINVVHDRKTGRSRGFAFVYYKHMEDAKEAKDRCNGVEIDGRKIRVDFSITKRAHTPTPGIYLGRPTGTRGRPSGDYGGYGRSYSRRSPSPYYSRGRRGYSRSRSRSRSYSPSIEDYLKNET